MKQINTYNHSYNNSSAWQTAYYEQNEGGIANTGTTSIATAINKLCNPQGLLITRITTSGELTQLPENLLEQLAKQLSKDIEQLPTNRHSTIKFTLNSGKITDKTIKTDHTNKNNAYKYAYDNASAATMIVVCGPVASTRTMGSINATVSLADLFGGDFEESEAV